MDISQQYFKVRRNFGRQPLFCETPVYLLDSIEPNKVDQKQYILRNPVNTESQAYHPKSEHYINTKQIFTKDEGANHAEGGWPKDVQFDDEESTARYKRRIERDNNYVDAVLDNYDIFEHHIKQNNAINMYNMYFKELPPQQQVEKCLIRINNIFKDPNNRPISSLNWTNEEDSKLVVSYCNKTYPNLEPLNTKFDCFVWNLENPEAPSTTILPPSACWQLACSPVDPALMIGGLEDGCVCLFDIRAHPEPTAISPMHFAHRDPVTSILYVQTRLNTEFFSGSSDGKCSWWDLRNLSTPVDEMIISINAPHGKEYSLEFAEPVSCLQFEKTAPTKFLCGTDTGYVINVNRKGKSLKEILSAVFNAHLGPVRNVQRSPVYLKVFITCGDWSTHIWSDDVHTSPIITGAQQRYKINDVSWAPQRGSSYMTVGSDGKFRFWDLLRKPNEPTMTLSISNTPLLKVKPNEEGRFVAAGNTKGAVTMLSLSESMVFSGDSDKQLMIQMFDREGRREHILETRVKEIRLKLKAEEGPAQPEVVVDEEAALVSAETEYKRIVNEEMRKIGVTASIASSKKAMRDR